MEKSGLPNALRRDAISETFSLHVADAGEDRCKFGMADLLKETEEN